MPSSRKEFEHNMHLFSEKLEKGEVSIAQSNVKTIKVILNARYGPKGRANLHTINEMARLMANTIANMMQHKDFKTDEDEQE